MTQEDYVSFETAKLLKEKGFEGRMHTFYTEEGTEMESAYVVPSNFFPIYRPTIQMAMKWLRKEKDVQIEITIVGTDTWESPTKWMYGFRCQTKDVIDRRNAVFPSYEEACEAAIRHCLENLI